MIGDRRSDIQAAKTTIYGQLAVNSGLRIIDILAIVQTLREKAEGVSGSSKK
jgi:hypothetical protein